MSRASKRSKSRHRAVHAATPAQAASRRRARLLGTVAVVLAPLFALLLVRVGGMPFRTVTWAYAAFLIGTLLELSRLTKNPGTTARMALGAVAISLFNFVPYKRENGYSFQDHLDNWPIGFAGSLLLIMVATYSKRLTARLGEGSTLLHSIAFFYWMLDRHATESGSLWLVVLAALPLTYAMVHALTELPLSRAARLGLSLWSTIVMAAFAIHYTVSVIQLGSVEARLAEADPERAALVFTEFVLLGAAGATIVQNLAMLFGYLPSKRHFFNKEYFEEARALTQSHVERFAAEQVPRAQAALAIGLAAALLVANWNLRLVSTSFVIWFVLAGVPWIVTAVAWWRREHPVTAVQRPVGDAAK